MFHNVVLNHIKKRDKVNNYFIDLYLNASNKRVNINQKPFFIDYIIIMIYLFNLFKLCIPFMVELDFETRLIIYDLPMFFGGVEKYNTIVFVLTCIMGIYLHKMLFLITSKKLMVWTQLFEMTRGNVSPLKLGLDITDSVIVNKFISRANFAYKVLNLSIFSYGKLI